MDEGQVISLGISVGFVKAKKDAGIEFGAFVIDGTVTELPLNNQK